MSAFFGIFRANGAPVDPAELENMAAAMRRRGPDAVNIWHRGDIGLGHCMMWTTPEALHENPPLVSQDRQRVVSADVRLDNREQLLGTLRTFLHTGHRPPAEIGDHELILAAYEKWGLECPKHLLGDFAFAIWDQTNQSVFCARDHFGSKPFHYFHSDRLFVFASEVKGILEIADVPARINEPRIADYLVEQLEGIDKTCTFYQDIFRLPPATTMLVDRRGMRQERYWQLDPSKSINLENQSEYTQAFLEVFTQAVECRLRSHKPPASMLSGGIDSSAIVAIGRDLRLKQGLEALHTISALSDIPGNCIESQAALAVINQGDVIPHVVTPSGIPRFQPEVEDFINDCDDIFSLIGIGVPLATYCLAKECGINVLLDGIDGDLVTSHGSHYLAYLLKAGQWREALNEAKSHSRNYYRGGTSPFSLLLRNARTAFVPHGLRKLLHGTRARQRLKRALSGSIINRKFAEEVELSARLERLYAHLRQPLPETLRESQANLLDQGFITVALERYDRQATSQSVEARHPYFDIRLVEFCLALPWHQRIQNGYSKALLRHSMAERLPESVRWRIGGWEHLSGEFKPPSERMQLVLMQSAIAAQLLRLNRFIEPDRLTRISKASDSASEPRRLRSHQVKVGVQALWLNSVTRRYQV